MQEIRNRYNTSDDCTGNEAWLFDTNCPINICITQKENCDTMANTNQYVHIYYVLKGMGSIITSENKADLLINDIIFLPASYKYSIRPYNGEKLELVRCQYIPDYLLQKGISLDNGIKYSRCYINEQLDAGKIIHPKVSSKAHQRIELIIADMLSEYFSKVHNDTIILLLDLLKLLFLVEEEMERSELCHTEKEDDFVEKNRHVIQYILKYIDENYNENINLDKACRLSMMSKSYFSYLFKKITGKTFVEYMNAIRIRKAMEKLQSDNLSINDICYDVGFSNICHFNRIFKKIVGVSPTVYRKNRDYN